LVADSYGRIRLKETLGVKRMIRPRVHFFNFLALILLPYDQCKSWSIMIIFHLSQFLEHYSIISLHCIANMNSLAKDSQYCGSAQTDAVVRHYKKTESFLIVLENVNNR
jgi:hypothetical protein